MRHFGEQATDGTVKSADGVGKLAGTNGSSGGGGQPHSDSSSRQTVSGVSTSVSDSHALHATERDATLMAAACSTASALQNGVYLSFTLCFLCVFGAHVRVDLE